MITIVVGTRPQFIKLAVLVKTFKDEDLKFQIIHTGQHYDYEMDRVFFEELNLPEPIMHLGVGSGSHGEQTGLMLERLEKAYFEIKPKVVIVPGDTNSALAGALAAVKLGIHVFHVEAGLRSRLPFMAEEINRVLVDHMSSLLFAPTETAYQNLLHEGIDKNRAYLTGDVMIDNIIQYKNKIDKTELPVEVESNNYIYTTTHRAENVDYPEKLKEIVEALRLIPEKYGLKVVLPLHPRTKKRLSEYNLLEKLTEHQDVYLIKPLSYFESLKLAKDAAIVLTDSGGLQKEAFVLGTPVVTMRRTTEWIETVKCGWNIITNCNKEKILNGIRKFLDNKPEPVNAVTLYGDGKASQRITNITKKFLEQIGVE